MKILLLGDVVGEPGMDALERELPALRRELGADFTLIDGENTCLNGTTPAHAERLLRAGADVVTLGNHAFDRREIADMLEQDERLLRPANLPRLPGRGSGIYEACHRPVGVLVLQGRAEMDHGPDNPFLTAEAEVEKLRASCKVVLVEIHAEATSEKQAMFYQLAGKVSVVFGTHTHVQTADETLWQGTGYLTDLGLCGPRYSVVGVEPKWSVDYFRNGRAMFPKAAAGGERVICGLLCDVDEKTGECLSLRRIMKKA